MIMDVIFGKKNFRNEIIWHYNSGARGSKDFGKRHDIIYRYSKTDNYYVDFECDEAIVARFESLSIFRKESTI